MAERRIHLFNKVRHLLAETITLNLFALASVCFLIKVAANLVFKPLTSRWFVIGLCTSITLGFLLFLALIHFNVMAVTKASVEYALFSALGTWLLGLIPLNLLVLPAFYWWDKRIASNGSETTLRIPENAFHALTFIGGYLGAWIGQTRFHHKVSKQSFQVKHYVICALSIVLYALLGLWFYQR